jgi:hypothetical protein
MPPLFKTQYRYPTLSTFGSVPSRGKYVWFERFVAMWTADRPKYQFRADTFARRYFQFCRLTAGAEIWILRLRLLSMGQLFPLFDKTNVRNETTRMHYSALSNLYYSG